MLHVVPDAEPGRHRLVDCPCRLAVDWVEHDGRIREVRVHRELGGSPLPPALRR